MKSLFSPLPSNTKTIVAFLRITVGALLLYHGAEVFNQAQIKEYGQWNAFKNFSSPTLLPYFGKATEFLCGLLLLLGLFTRIGALVLILSMAYITFKIGHGKFWQDDQHPFMFLLFGLLFFFTGPGKWSLDNIIFKPRPKYTTYK